MKNILDIMAISLIKKIILNYLYPTKKQINIWKKIHQEKNSWMKFRVKTCPICLFMNLKTIKNQTVWEQFFSKRLKTAIYPFCKYI